MSSGARLDGDAPTRAHGSGRRHLGLDLVETQPGALRRFVMGGVAATAVLYAPLALTYMWFALPHGRLARFPMPS